jgi:hypothetical protein
MYEVTDWKTHIHLRLEEKRKISKARRGASWLLMFASGLVMLTLLRVSVLFSSVPLVLPVLFWVFILVSLGAVYSLTKAYHFIKESELVVAAQLVQLALVVTVFSVFMLIVGISEWFAELKSLPRMVSGGLLVFLSFYILNVIIGSFSLHAVYRKLKNYEIHSMNMSSFHKIFSFFVFLVITFLIFSITLGL